MYGLSTFNNGTCSHSVLKISINCKLSTSIIECLEFVSFPLVVKYPLFVIFQNLSFAHCP